MKSPVALFAAILAALVPPVYAGGSIIQTLQPLGNTGNYALTFSWTGDAVTGEVPAVQAQLGPRDQGLRIQQVEIVPGLPAPAAGYSVQLLDSFGGELMSGELSNLSSTEVQIYAAGAATPPIMESFSLRIDGQTVAGAHGRVVVFFGPTNTAASATASSGLGAGMAIADYDFAPQRPGGELAAGVSASVTLKPCPWGVGGSDSRHYLYVSGGTGTGEPVLISGGTCVPGAAAGTVTFTPSNDHRGPWTIGSATAGIQEAANFAGPNSLLDAGSRQMTVYQTATLGASNVTLRCSGCKIASNAPGETGLPNGRSTLVVAGDSITLEGLWLDNRDHTTNSYNLILIAENARNIRIRDCTFSGPRAVAIQVDATGVSGILVSGNTFAGVIFGFLANSRAVDISDIRIVENRFEAISGDAINFNVYRLGSYVPARNVSIVGNNIDASQGLASDQASGFCIAIAGIAKGTITGNTLHNCRFEGIHFESGTMQAEGPLDWVISSNEIDGTGSGVPGENTGIWLLNCTYCAISDNVVSGAHDHGIHAAYDPREQSMSLSITGNILRGNGGDGIRLEGQVSRGRQRWQVAHNIAADNQGNGLVVSGVPREASITDNSFDGNTGYGAVLKGAIGALTWRDNETYDNAAGDLALDSINGALMLENARSWFAASFDGDSAYTNAINLGQSAQGQLIVRVFDEEAPARNFTTSTFFIVWNGAILETCSSGLSCSPAIIPIAAEDRGTFSGISLRMEGNILQVQASNAGDSTTAGFDIQFLGSIVRRN